MVVVHPDKGMVFNMSVQPSRTQEVGIEILNSTENLDFGISTRNGAAYEYLELCQYKSCYKKRTQPYLRSPPMSGQRLD